MITSKIFAGTGSLDSDGSFERQKTDIMEVKDTD